LALGQERPSLRTNALAGISAVNSDAPQRGGHLLGSSSPSPGSGAPLPFAVPWDQTYLSRWFNFLKVIADRYAGRNSFRKIAAAGPTSVSAEMSLPESRDDIAQWKRLEPYQVNALTAWKQTFSAYASTFPHQYFSLALHQSLPIPAGTQRAETREQVVSLGLQYPRQFALQADGLNSNAADEKYGYRSVREHSGRVATGLMMTTAATLRPERMGASSDPVENLRLSIKTGMVPNDQGQVVKYLEIYEPDIVNPSMQQVLREANQQLLKRASP
jgi:hypothetical protein